MLIRIIPIKTPTIALNILGPVVRSTSAFPKRESWALFRKGTFFDVEYSTSYVPEKLGINQGVQPHRRHRIIKDLKIQNTITLSKSSALLEAP